MKTYISLTWIIPLVKLKHLIVLTMTNFSTELTASVTTVWKENTMVLKKMNTTVKQYMFVISGVLMRTVIVQKILMLVKMNGDHYVYTLTSKTIVNVTEILLANTITLVIIPVSVIKLLILSLVIQVLLIVVLYILQILVLISLNLVGMVLIVFKKLPLQLTVTPLYGVLSITKLLKCVNVTQNLSSKLMNLVNIVVSN
jgi:hypothetical protein